MNKESTSIVTSDRDTGGVHRVQDIRMITKSDLRS
jgi:hypothetical protein